MLLVTAGPTWERDTGGLEGGGCSKMVGADMVEVGSGEWRVYGVQERDTYGEAITGIPGIPHENIWAGSLLQRVTQGGVGWGGGWRLCTMTAP